MWPALIALFACSTPSVDERVAQAGFTRTGPAPVWVLGPEGTYTSSHDGEGSLATLEVRDQSVFLDLELPDRYTLQGVRLYERYTYAWTGTLPEEPVFDATVAGEGTLELRVTGAGEPITVTRDLTDDAQRWRVPLEGRSGDVTLSLSLDGSLGFASGAVVRPASQEQPRRVVVIGMDTTRPDHFSTFGYDRNTTPQLDAFGASAAVFERAWAPAPRTRPSFRAATTGRWPLDAVGSVNIGAVFRSAGFATAGFTANPHLVPRFDFNNGFDTWRMDGTATAEDQVDRALGWLQSQQDRDAYLFLHIMDPHLRYQAPEPWVSRWIEGERNDAMARWTRARIYRKFRSNKLDDAGKAELEARYDAELAYADDQLGRFLTALDGLPGETLVVVHSDHGEEFWEHDQFEHNHTLYEELVRAVLMVRAPRQDKGSRHAVPASLVDIAPTLFQLTGLEPPPELDGHSLAPLMFGGDAPWQDRPLPVGSLRYDAERWGVVHDGHKYILHTDSGTEELFDLVNDPGELQDLARTADLAPFRSALAQAHGMPVGPGWRVSLTLRGQEPVSIELPEACEDAGIYDPWRLKRVRENLAWGEKRTSPLPEEVATVALSDDKRTVTLTPGEVGRGVLWVRFAQPVAPAGTVRKGDEDKPVRQKVRIGEHSLRFSSGIVLDPPMHEAARIEQLQQAQESAEEGDLELLRQLGYIGDE